MHKTINRQNIGQPDIGISGHFTTPHSLKKLTKKNVVSILHNKSC